LDIRNRNLDIIWLLWFVIWFFKTNFIRNQNYELAVHNGLFLNTINNNQ